MVIIFFSSTYGTLKFYKKNCRKNTDANISCSSKDEGKVKLLLTFCSKNFMIKSVIKFQTVGSMLPGPDNQSIALNLLHKPIVSNMHMEHLH